MDTRTRQKVDEKVKEHAKTVIGKKKLEERLMEDYGITRDEAEDRVLAMIRQGTLFEPEPGKVKMLRS